MTFTWISAAPFSLETMTEMAKLLMLPARHFFGLRRIDPYWIVLANY